MERLAEDRKGPSSMEHKKKQMVAALETNLKVRLTPHPTEHQTLLKLCSNPARQGLVSSSLMGQEVGSSYPSVHTCMVVHLEDAERENHIQSP